MARTRSSAVKALFALAAVMLFACGVANAGGGGTRGRVGAAIRNVNALPPPAAAGTWLKRTAAAAAAAASTAAPRGAFAAAAAADARTVAPASLLDGEGAQGGEAQTPPRAGAALLDGTPSAPSESTPRVAQGFAAPQANAPRVAISPPALKYGPRTICQPHTLTVQVTNTGKSHEVVVHTISSDTTSFFPLGFEVTAVEAGGTAELQIAYLPRELGEDRGTLVVHTSAGAFIVRVEGAGELSPFNVQPLAGVTAPVGVRRDYLLSMHNPFSETLWVKEVFTNEDFARIVLPAQAQGFGDEGAGADQATEASSKNVWAIPPHSTRPIISLQFKGDTMGSYLGLLHIRTEQDTLMIPMEMQAIEGSVYRIPDEVDFGMLTTEHRWGKREVRVVNGGPLPLAINKVYASPLDSSLKLRGREGSVVAPYSEAVVAVLLHSGSKEGYYAGSVTIRTNATTPSGARMEVPYRAHVIHGSLLSNPRAVTFRASSGSAPVRRSIPLVNTFPTGLTVYSVLSEDKHVEVLSVPGSLGDQDASSMLTVAAGAALPPLEVRVAVGDAPARPFEAKVAVFTNMTTLRVAIRVYTGEVKVIADEPPAEKATAASDSRDSRAPAVAALDFGLVGASAGLSHTRSVQLVNLNPVSVTVGPVKVEGLRSLALQLGEVYQRNRHIETIEAEGETTVTAGRGAVLLRPGDAVRLTVVATMVATGAASGVVAISTSHGPMRVPVSLEGVEGKLLADMQQTLDLGVTFPGVLMTQQVWVTSTYPKDVQVLASSSTDDRVTLVMRNRVLRPQVASHVADIIVNIGEGSLLSRDSHLPDGTILPGGSVVAVAGGGRDMA
mmetsp:Transcript_10404/g.43048  ORF Transcript_10404/g.43048 Transcript_10404/m.43048 type:complete len:838 (-) Transcript_10404:1-2514(-)